MTLGLFELIRKSRHAKSILMALNRKIAYLREDEIAKVTATGRSVW